MKSTCILILELWSIRHQTDLIGTHRGEREESLKKGGGGAEESPYPWPSWTCERSACFGPGGKIPKDRFFINVCFCTALLLGRS